jgi:hypothetical protein
MPAGHGAADDRRLINGAGAAHRICRQRIAPAEVSLFRQSRPMGMGFARAFLTARHIEATGMAVDAFWRDVEARRARATPDQLTGTFDWAVLHFRRVADHEELPMLESRKISNIGYQGALER